MELHRKEDQRYTKSIKEAVATFATKESAASTAVTESEARRLIFKS